MQHPETMGLSEKDTDPIKYDISDYILYSKLGSIIIFILDVCSDYYIAATYLQDNKLWYFALTLLFVVLPSIVISVMNVIYYLKKAGLKKRSKHDTLLLLSCLLLISPLVRLVRSFKYSLKCKRAGKEGNTSLQKVYYENMLLEDTDVAILRLVECFLESASQLILQLTILITEEIYKMKTLEESCKLSTTSFFVTYPKNMVSIGISFLSLGWSLASYQKSIRALAYVQLNWGVTFIIFFAYFFITVSRILSIVAAATVYWPGILAALFVHWMFMFVWLLLTYKVNSKTLKEYVFKIVFNLFLGIVYIFSYVGLTYVKGLNSYIFYYTMVLVENILAVSVWICYLDCEGGIVMIILIPLNFILGILLMIIYYQVYHPTIGCKDWGLVVNLLLNKIKPRRSGNETNEVFND